MAASVGCKIRVFPNSTDKVWGSCVYVEYCTLLLACVCGVCRVLYYCMYVVGASSQCRCRALILLLHFHFYFFPSLSNPWLAGWAGLIGWMGLNGYARVVEGV